MTELFWIQADMAIKGEPGKPVLHLTDSNAAAGQALCGFRMPLDVAGVVAYDKAQVNDKSSICPESTFGVCHGCLRMVYKEILS